MSATVVLAKAARFDPFAEKYRCCCNWCMAHDGTIFLAVLEVISVAVSFVVAGINVATLQRSAAAAGHGASTSLDYDYAAIFIAGISAITLTLLYFGFKRSKPSLLIPHMIRRVFLICFIFILICMIMGTRISWAEFQTSNTNCVQKQTDDGNSGECRQLNDQVLASRVRGGVPLKIFLGLVVILLESWMLWVNVKCYKFLRDKAHYLLLTQSGSPSFNSNDNILGTESSKGVSV